jgi:hypothetical protein
MRGTIQFRTFCLLVCCLKTQKLDIIFLVVLYGCETLSLAIKEEHGLRVSENRVLRRIFEPTKCMT